MQIDLIISFIFASIALTIMPGPDNIFVLTESITKGRKNGIGISIGLVLGVMVHTLAAATGISIIIQNSDFLFNLIKYLGAFYLCYLAFLATKEEMLEISYSDDIEQGDSFNLPKLIKKGFLMNVLNPKVSLFFIAFLPQFIAPYGWGSGFQMLMLGFIFMIQALVIFSVISIFSGTFSTYLNSPKFWKYTKWTKIIVLLVLAGLILI